MATKLQNRWTSLVLAGAVLVAAAFSGCAKPPKIPADMPRLFASEAFDAKSPGAHEVCPQSKYALYQREVQPLNVELPPIDHKDYAMLAGNRAMIRLALGDIDGACQDAMTAQSIMTGKVKGEEGKATAAQLADEGSKVFKGECYEIAMLNSIVGLCHLQNKDAETAAIGFRRALEADKMSKEDARDDFALAYWGLGMANIQTDSESAKQAFTKIGYKPLSTVQDENLVFVVSLGKAPWKGLYGAYGEHDQLLRTLYEPAAAEIFVDGKSIGRTFKLVDLFHQSQGVRKTEKDTGQGVKGGTKLVLASLLGAVIGGSAQDLFESAWSVKADTRVCYMLPNEIQVLSAKVAPGRHRVNVKFYNSANNELTRYEQAWYCVPAPATGRRYVNIRSEFDRCNVQGPVPFTRISKISSRTVKTGETSRKETTVQFRAANLPNPKIGDKITLCHFYKRTQMRTDTTYHWRSGNMQYNNKGQAIGIPGVRHRMQDYDIGVIGYAEIVSISGEGGEARVTSLTTSYQPKPNDMVTMVKKVGRLWK